MAGWRARHARRPRSAQPIAQRPRISNDQVCGSGVSASGGATNIFTDTSVLTAQSCTFTEQGGAVTIWLSNGDINAGKGAKTVADVPQPIYVCDSDFYCTRGARGEVTGASIATLQTIPGAPAANVELAAPRGAVDFGAAGVRSSASSAAASALQQAARAPLIRKSKPVQVKFRGVQIQD